MTPITHDIPTLARRFGAPGRIAFRPGAQGRPPIIALVNRYGACELSLEGGQIVNYRPLGHLPIVFTPRNAEESVNEPIRGGLSILCPCPALLSSSPAPDSRNAGCLPWVVTATEYSSEMTDVRLSCSPSAEGDPSWPLGIELELHVWLDQQLNVELTTVNRGARSFTVTQALLPCFRVRDVRDITIHGLDDAPFADHLTGQTGRHQGALAVRNGIEQAFSLKTPECVLLDPSLGRVMSLSYSGASRLLVWNPGNAGSGPSPTFGPEEVKSMIGLGPAAIGDDSITLPPGGTHAVRLSIQAALR